MANKLNCLCNSIKSTSLKWEIPGFRFYKTSSRNKNKRSRMWLHVLQVYLSIHLNFVSVCAQDPIPAVDQIKIAADRRPCLLNSETFRCDEGGYESLLEDCNPFDRFRGHPPQYVERYRGIAPIVSGRIDHYHLLCNLKMHLSKSFFNILRFVAQQMSISFSLMNGINSKKATKKPNWANMKKYCLDSLNVLSIMMTMNMNLAMPHLSVSQQIVVKVGLIWLTALVLTLRRFYVF